MATDHNVSELPFVVNQNAKEIYVDGYKGVAINSGVVKFSYYSTNFNPDTGKGGNYENLRLVMSLPTLLSIHKALGELVSELEKDGVVARKQEK